MQREGVLDGGRAAGDRVGGGNVTMERDRTRSLLGGSGGNRVDVCSSMERVHKRSGLGSSSATVQDPRDGFGAARRNAGQGDGRWGTVNPNDDDVEIMNDSATKAPWKGFVNNNIHNVWNHGRKFEGGFHCRYCNLRSRGGGATRFKEHLGGIVGEVRECPNVPKNIRDAMKDARNETRQKKREKAARKLRLERDIMDRLCHREGVINIEDDDEEEQIRMSLRESLKDKNVSRAVERRHESGSGVRVSLGKRSITAYFDRELSSNKVSMQPKISTAMDLDSREVLGQAWAKFFQENDIAGFKANCPYFRAAMKITQQLGPTPIPTAKEIDGIYLDKNYDEAAEWLKLFQQDWKNYGVTVMCDSWTGPTSMSIINFMVYCNARMFFHKSIDASGQTQNSEFLYKEIKKVVVEEIGHENVVQIVTDNGSNYKKACRTLVEQPEYNHIVWQPCAAHTVNLMLKDIAKFPHIDVIVKSAKQICRFFHNHNNLHDSMKNNVGGELIKPNATRFGTVFMFLESYHEKKDQFRKWMVSNNWKESVWKNDADSAVLAFNEISAYRKCRGRFGQRVARLSAERMSPTEWWFQFGGEVPNLQKYALRIVSQCVSSSGCERNWSAFALVHTQQRIRLLYGKLHKCVSVRYNLKIRAEEDQDPVRENSKEKEVDPCAMMMDAAMFDKTNPMMEWLNEDEEHIILDGAEAAAAVFEKIRFLNSSKKATHLGRKNSSRKRTRDVEEVEEVDDYSDSEDDDQENGSMGIDDDDGQDDDCHSDGEDSPRQVENEIDVLSDGNLASRRSGRVRQTKKIRDITSLYKPVKIAKRNSNPCPDTAPAWVLLEPLAYIADHTNATTAEASSSTGHTVRVTVCLTDPLGVSHVCVHCPSLKDTDFCNRPTVVCSEKDYLILSVVFIFGPHAQQGLREYFVYKASPGRPSLHLLPGPFPRGLTDTDIALVPDDDDGDGAHFVLAALRFTLHPWVYDLHIFSSRTWAWSLKVAQAEVSPEVRTGVSTISASKAIRLGGGTVGWVDLWTGIAVYNVLDETPVLRFIQVPQLMPGHMEGSKSSGPIRNVSCSNGVIKFVEIEKHERHDPDGRPFDDMDTLTDSDCLPKPKVVGWRAMTWYRMASWDHWRRGCMAYDNEILVDYQRHSMLLPEQTDNNAGKLTLKNMLASFPVLSLTCDYDDIVYMLCETKSGHKKSWLISVDLKKKMLVELAPFPLQGYFDLAHPSILSKYLNIAPGLDLSVKASTKDAD